MSIVRKTIAIVTPVFPPYRGGIGKMAQQDAEQLAALGYDVTVHVPALGAVPPSSAYKVKVLKPWLRFGLGALVPQVGKLLNENDLTVLHYPFYGGAEPLWRARLAGGAGRGSRGKLAVMYHMDVVGRGLIGAYMKWHTRALMPRIVASGDRVLVTSFDYAAAGNVAPLLASDPAKFAEMPPSVDVEAFAPAPKSGELMEKYGIATTDKVVVQLGGLDKPHYFKGVPFLLQALSMPSLQRARAVIVGDGDLRATFARRAVELGIDDRVTFAGSVSEYELADHLRLGDVFAFPSTDKSEAFGIAALEAAACGVPVVASNLAGVRTVVRDGVNGLLVPPANAAALASALAALLNDDARRARFGAAGRDIAVREYAEPVRLQRWKDVLTDLGIAA